MSAKVLKTKAEDTTKKPQKEKAEKPVKEKVVKEKVVKEKVVKAAKEKVVKVENLAQEPLIENKKPLLPSGSIHISRARCEWYMRHYISDDVVEGKIKELKESLKTLTSEDEIKNAKAAIDGLNKGLFRVSHYAPTAVAIVADTVVKDLVRYGINQVTQSGKKTLDISYFQTENIKSLRYYSLFGNILSALNTAALAEVADSKKKKEGDVVEEAEPQTDTQSDGMTFTTYITNAINDIKKEVDTTKIIIGTRVKKYLNDLVIELIKRIVVITKSLLKSIINVRTIVPEHIKAVTNIFLLDGNALSGDVDDLLKFIDEKVEESKTVQPKSDDKVEVAAAE